MLPQLRLIPRDEQFSELLTRAAANTLEGARLFHDLLEHPEDVERKARHLKDLEHAGDELTHRVFDALNRSFVTPFDRGDIGQLAGALDDVIDWIEEAARRIRLYRFTETSPTARKFGRIIVEQTERIVEAVPLLQNGRQVEDLERATREIHRLENEADDLLADAIATLYDGVTEVPQLIHAMRWGDIYQLLEDATDKAEHVATDLRNMAVKQS